jgi:hypothetical protein
MKNLSYTELRERFLSSPVIKLLLERGKEEEVEKLWIAETHEMEQRNRPSRP